MSNPVHAIISPGDKVYVSLYSGNLDIPFPPRHFTPEKSSHRSYLSSSYLSHPFLFNKQFPYLPFIPRSLPTSHDIFKCLRHSPRNPPIHFVNGNWDLIDSVRREWIVLEDLLFLILVTLHPHVKALRDAISLEQLKMSGPYRFVNNKNFLFPFRFGYRYKPTSVTYIREQVVTYMSFRAFDAFRPLLGLVIYTLSNSVLADMVADNKPPESWKNHLRGVLLPNGKAMFQETWLNALDHALLQSRDGPLLGTVLELPLHAEYFALLRTFSVPMWFERTIHVQRWMTEHHIHIDELESIDGQSLHPRPDKQSRQSPGESMEAFFAKISTWESKAREGASPQDRDRWAGLERYWGRIFYAPTNQGNPVVFHWIREHVIGVGSFWMRRKVDRSNVEDEWDEWCKLRCIRYNQIFNWYDVWEGWTDGADIFGQNYIGDEKFDEYEKEFEDIQFDGNFIEDTTQIDLSEPYVAEPSLDLQDPSTDSSETHGIVIPTPADVLSLRCGALHVDGLDDLKEPTEEERIDMMRALGDSRSEDTILDVPLSEMFNIFTQISRGKSVREIVPHESCDIALSKIGSRSSSVLGSHEFRVRVIPYRYGVVEGFILREQVKKEPWILLLPSATTTLECLRLLAREPNLSFYDIAKHLLLRGTAFRTLAPTALCRDPVPIGKKDIRPYQRPSFLGSRTDAWKFGMDDYRQYVDLCRSVLQGSWEGRAAMLQGGLVWRIAVWLSGGDWDWVCGGPVSIPEQGNHIVEGQAYYDDELSTSNLEILLGKYHIRPSSYTNGTRNPKVVWLWPPLHKWAPKRFWSAENERWFKKRSQDIEAVAKGTLDKPILVQGEGWGKANRNNGPEQKAGEAIERFSKTWFDD